MFCRELSKISGFISLLKGISQEEGAENLDNIKYNMEQN